MPARCCASIPTARVPADNPFAAQGGVAAQIWTLGHRNPLGLAFAPDGRLWEVEMGPRGGDEMNLIERGRNYGYPRVSNGDHYDGRDIPDHSPGDGFEPPKVWWTPVISPGDMIVYSGSDVPAVARRRADRRAVRPGAGPGRHRRRPMPARPSAGTWAQRIREVEQAPDGSVYLLEDQQDGARRAAAAADAGGADRRSPCGVDRP